jgi:hypothetical protein
MRGIFVSSSAPLSYTKRIRRTPASEREERGSLEHATPNRNAAEPGHGAKKMSTTRFETTLHAIKDGAKSFTVEKATSNIEGWEEYLSKHEHDGVKKVVQDLAKLKKLLHADTLDGEAIKSLVKKLGKDTVAVAGHEETANAKHIRELGQALESAA